MEPLFICEHRPTVWSVAEQSRKMQPVKTYGTALLGLFFFAHTLRGALLNQFQNPWLVYFVLSCVYLLWLVPLPEINAFLAIRQAKKQLGTAPCSTLYFGDNIRITQAGEEMTWEYSEVRYVRQFRRSFLLVKKEGMGISVDPKGFTKGDFESFKAFLGQQCPEITLPK